MVVDRAELFEQRERLREGLCPLDRPVCHVRRRAAFPRDRFDVGAPGHQIFDHLDILVNNAGFGVLKPLVEMDLASFEQVFATNVTGAMLMAREAAKHFVKRRSGNIVNIGSTAAVRGAAKRARSRTRARRR